MSTMTITSITQAPSVRVAPVARPDVSHGEVRLTRRGRLVVLLVALVIALGVGVALGGVSVASGEAGASDATRVVVVNEGDTLWGIAAGVADDGEVREMVSEIRDLNSLDSSVVMLGQKLHVPTDG